MRRLQAILLSLALLMPAYSIVPAYAIVPGEGLADPDLERRARALSLELRCLVCQNQSIDDSEAELARDLRQLVRARLTAGQSDDEIRTAIVERYGEFVLFRPQFGPHTFCCGRLHCLSCCWVGFGLIVSCASPLQSRLNKS